jgi:hypothetical protein
MGVTTNVKATMYIAREYSRQQAHATAIEWWKPTVILAQNVGDKRLEWSVRPKKYPPLIFSHWKKLDVRIFRYGKLIMGND